MWRVERNVVSHPLLKDPLVIPLDDAYEIVSSDETHVELTARLCRCACITLDADRVTCEMTEITAHEDLRSWMKLKSRDFHVVGYKVKKPHTVLSEKHPFTFACGEKVYMSTEAGGAAIGCALLELSFFAEKLQFDCIEETYNRRVYSIACPKHTLIIERNFMGMIARVSYIRNIALE